MPSYDLLIDFQVNVLLCVAGEIVSKMPKYIFKDLEFSSHPTSINSVIYYVWSLFEAYHNIHLCFITSKELFLYYFI